MNRQRDEKGRFITGYAGGPGRPKREIELDALRTLNEAVAPNWNALCQKVIDLALDGDLKAFELLAAYYIGKPAQIVELKAGEQRQLAEVLTMLAARGVSVSALLAAISLQLVANDG